MRESAPRRAYTVTIKADGDTWEEAVDMLSHFLEHVREHGPACNLVTGGSTGGGWVHVAHDPDMTHKDVLREYVAELRAKIEEPDPPGGRVVNTMDLETIDERIDAGIIDDDEIRALVRIARAASGPDPARIVSALRAVHRDAAEVIDPWLGEYLMHLADALAAGLLGKDA